MGRALKDTEIKVPGAPGPLSKGMPMTQFAGKGGAFNALRGRPVDQNMKMPGYKSLMKKGIDSGKIKKPALPQGSMFSKLFNKGKPEIKKPGGLFSGVVQQGIDSGKFNPPPGWPNSAAPIKNQNPSDLTLGVDQEGVGMGKIKPSPPGWPNSAAPTPTTLPQSTDGLISKKIY